MSDVTPLDAAPVEPIYKVLKPLSQIQVLQGQHNINQGSFYGSNAAYIAPGYFTKGGAYNRNQVIVCRSLALIAAFRGITKRGEGTSRTSNELPFSK